MEACKFSYNRAVGRIQDQTIYCPMMSYMKHNKVTIWAPAGQKQSCHGPCQLQLPLQALLQDIMQRDSNSVVSAAFYIYSLVLNQDHEGLQRMPALLAQPWQSSKGAPGLGHVSRAAEVGHYVSSTARLQADQVCAVPVSAHECKEVAPWQHLLAY